MMLSQIKTCPRRFSLQFPVAGGRRRQARGPHQEEVEGEEEEEAEEEKEEARIMARWGARCDHCREDGGFF